MAFLLIFFPVVMAVVAALVKSNRVRPFLLPVTAVLHSALSYYIIFNPGFDNNGTWLALDPIGKVVLLLVSTLFLLCSFYAVSYLWYRSERDNRIFVICLLGFLSMISLVTWAQHLGLLWVAIEATTLTTAPLIYFNRSRLSIEATWKFLLIGSVGIALALLGTFFMAYSSLHAGLGATLSYSALLKNAPLLSKVWLHAGFILLLVGYGTKMGLAPMHTWKPDAYGESPGLVGAIFAGAVTSCAFLAFLRIYHICYAAGEQAYMSKLLLFIGFFSMAVAALFMIRQRDLKRLLAYSSVEHMGIMIIGLGIGVPALYGTILHIIMNGLTKGVLFLTAGNIHRAYGSKNIDQVHGAIRLLPLSGSLFLAAFFAITGSPPFGPFISEFSIISGAFESHAYVTGGLLLFFLCIIFIGMGATILSAVQGNLPIKMNEKKTFQDNFFNGAPIVCMMILVLMLGLFIPAPLQNLISNAVQFLGRQS